MKFHMAVAFVLLVVLGLVVAFVYGITQGEPILAIASGVTLIATAIHFSQLLDI